jgi:hypothetical protein
MTFVLASTFFFPVTALCFPSLIWKRGAIYSKLRLYCTQKIFLSHTYPALRGRDGTRNKTHREPGMVVHGCNPTLRKVRQEDCEFQISIDYIAQKGLALMAHICNPRYLGGRDQEDHGSKPAWANSL